MTAVACAKRLLNPLTSLPEAYAIWSNVSTTALTAVVIPGVDFQLGRPVSSTPWSPRPGSAFLRFLRLGQLAFARIRSEAMIVVEPERGRPRVSTADNAS